jgi:hypothetical protein
VLAAALVVRLYNGFGVPAPDLAVAQSTAGGIFADGGVRAVWIDCGSGGRRPAAPCDRPVAPGEVVLRIVAARGRSRSNDSMGFALVNPGAASMLATVYGDAVLTVARQASVDPSVLLGRVVAHELGHLLLSTRSHASAGLMRATWMQAELRRKTPADWQFLASETGELRSAITSRANGFGPVERPPDLVDHTRCDVGSMGAREGGVSPGSRAPC